MFKLKSYQENGARNLIEESDRIIKLRNKRTKLVFKAPSGAGKTIVMTVYLNRFVREVQSKIELPYRQSAFIWKAPYQLHIQSCQKIREYFNQTRNQVLNHEVPGIRDSGIGNLGLIFPLLFIFTIAILTSCKYDKIPIAPESGLIRARVIDALTGPTILYAAPLEGADIYTYPPTVKGITDKNGDAFLENVPIGMYNVYAEKIGYYRGYYNTEVYSDKMSEIRILLRPLQKGNVAPVKPFEPFPKDSMKIYSNYISLEWKTYEPDDDLMYFDIFFGKDNPPIRMIRFNNIDLFYQIDTLESNTIYYWKINAKDIKGAITEGNVWQFRTK